MALTEVNSLGIKDLEVKTADIAAANVTLAKVENVTDGQIIVGNGSNRPTAVAVSGDVTLANTGAVTIATGAVEHAMLANDAVDGDNIADNSVTLAHMAGGTDGQIITYDASGDPVAVGPGTDGQVLTSTGAGSPPAFETISSSDTLSFRNIVINGAMNVAQRATSSTSSGYQTIDRIKVDFANLGQTCTVSQRALTSGDTGPFAKGFRNCLKIALASADTAAANKYIQWGYRIEGQDIVSSGWDYGSASSDLTVSFWIKVSAAQTFYLMMEGHSTGTNRYYVKPFTPSGTSWERITLTIPGDASTTGFNNDNATGIKFWIMPYYGTDYTATGTINSWHDGNASTSMPDMASTWFTTGTPVFELTGYQIEAGSSATEFEHRSYAEELARCQRYFWQLIDNNNTSIAIGSIYSASDLMWVNHHPVTMRASPSIRSNINDNSSYIIGRWYNATGGNNGSGNINIQRVNKNTILVYSAGWSLPEPGAVSLESNNTSCYLGYEAEL
jgi:hypothetical protein